MTAQDHAFQPFRHPIVSLFQSAGAAVERPTQAAPSAAEPEDAPAAPQVGAMLHATGRAAGALAAIVPAETAALLRRRDDAPTVEQCASAYLALALAEARQDRDAIAAAHADLARYGVCDDRWARALEEFLLHYTLTKHADVPYRRWTAMDDFVIDGDDALPQNAKIAIISDWGTGQPRAQALLEAVATLEPDVVIHLGDIYYSCNSREANAFVANIQAPFPPDKTRVFTLCGNHDMYSGAAPYYDALSALGQPASFFCLRNRDWQFLAMDTGYNDFDPFQEGAAITWVQDGTDARGDPSEDAYSELSWHLDKLEHAGSRKTILLSHHPLFTRNAPIGRAHAVNDRLLAQVGPWLGEIALWLWGHEHKVAVYEPFAGLQRGRCIGASAIPTLCSEDIYARSDKFAPGMAVPELIPPPAGRLPADPGTPYYDLGFAMIALDGPSACVTYYGYNQTTGLSTLCTEQL